MATLGSDYIVLFGEKYKKGVHGLAFRWDCDLKEWIKANMSWREVEALSGRRALESERYNFTGNNEEIKQGLDRS